MHRKILNLEKEHGNLHEFIPTMVNKHGQGKAAEIMGVCAATLSKWLKKNGYQEKRIWVRENENGRTFA